MRSVPVIDVSRLVAGRSDPAAVEAIGRASREWGFYQIVGHGLPGDLARRFASEQRRFFALPAADKAELARGPDDPMGYYDRELTKNRRDWKEIFDFGPDGASEVSNRWPRGLPGFRKVMLAWFEECERLSQRLLEAMCLALGVRADKLEEHFHPVHTSFLRLNYYPRCPEPAPADAPSQPDRGEFGVNRHTDAGALTILAQDGVGGLQVLQGERWSSVEPLPEALVINTGDMLQVWSNDRYRAPLHRVVADAQRERYSAPFFFNPSADTECAPLRELLGEGSPPRYRPVRWGDFRKLRADGDYTDRGQEVQVADYRI